MLVRLCVALLLLPGLQAVAATSRCGQHYAGQRAPEIINRKLSVDAHELCFSAFGVMHSGVTRTPLWSAEHLTRQAVEAAADLRASTASILRSSWRAAIARSCPTTHAAGMTAAT